MENQKLNITKFKMKKFKYKCKCGNEIETTWWKELGFFISDSLANAISAIVFAIILAIFLIAFSGNLINYFAKEYPDKTIKYLQTTICNQ